MAGMNFHERPIGDQIEEFKAKIQLLEGDRKAYYENSQWSIKQNRDLIMQLRKENKELHQTLSDVLAADDHVINKAFEGKPVERASLKNKTGQTAIGIMDLKKLDKEKRLNALRHKSAMKQKKLEELMTQYDQICKDAEEAAKTDEGVSKAAETMRDLENRFDKAQLKYNEAEHIRKTYIAIKDKLEEDSLNYPHTLDALEREILRSRAELDELQIMNKDAQLCKETALEDLRKHEEVVYSERKRREAELHRTKKEAEEKKQQHERIERRLQRAASIDELGGVQEVLVAPDDEEQERITTYEEAFRQIKEATGVSDTKEVVRRFTNQRETREHLEGLKQEHEKTIERLKEEKEQLAKQFEEMKYTGEAKLSSGQRLLEDFQEHLTDQEERRDRLQDQRDKNTELLVHVKSGVEHLADKLKHLKAAKSHVPSAQISSSSDEYVLDLLSQSEEKLLKLLEDLESQDLVQIQRQMDEEEFHAQYETKLPQNNVRVKLPVPQRDTAYDGQGADDDDSGDEGQDMLNRQLIKRQSQMLIESKSKRKTSKRKGKK